MILGFFSFGANLERPIQQQIAELYTGEEFLTSTDREARALEESKSKDTDGDGLVDYDELYVYRTSPYLTDSDSDGFSDQSEVFSGNNPNCPTGTDCSTGIADAEEVKTSSNVAAGLVSGLDVGGIMASGEIEFTNPEDVENFFKQATIDQIRAALIESGMDPAELAEIDDKTLEEFFYTVVDQASEEGQFNELVTEEGAEIDPATTEETPAQ